MRHRNTGRAFGRPSGHFKALFQNLFLSLLEHGHIKTTLPKAKELRKFAERLVTLSKQDSLSNRRLVISRVGNSVVAKTLVSKLFNEIAPKYKERPGGYLRILKCGFREGDNAPIALIEFV